MDWSWVVALAPDSEALKLVMALMVCITIVIVTQGVGGIRKAIKKGPDENSVDLMERINKIADKRLEDATKELDRVKLELSGRIDKLEEQHFKAENALRKALTKLNRAIKIAIQQQAYIERHLPERTDAPKFPDDLLTDEDYYSL